ncbi:hypothetical protein ACIOHE_39280 [Streptomyces sp. NPDC087851]|uniref:hypothetical protein n=1 Tax=Streptomyces sp. NPDC087851 TaxID=3365810 RepID=UPI00382AD972
MNHLALILGLAAYWLLGAAYIAWRSSRTGVDMSPMGHLRAVDKLAERGPALDLPVPVIVAVVAVTYVVMLTLWPLFAIRRAAIGLGIAKEPRT